MCVKSGVHALFMLWLSCTKGLMSWCPCGCSLLISSPREKKMHHTHKNTCTLLIYLKAGLGKGVKLFPSIFSFRDDCAAKVSRVACCLQATNQEPHTHVFVACTHGVQPSPSCPHESSSLHSTSHAPMVYSHGSKTSPVASLIFFVWKDVT